MDNVFQKICDIYPHYTLKSKLKKKFFYLIFTIFKFFLNGPIILNFGKFYFLAYPQKKNYSRSLLTKINFPDDNEVNFFIDNIDKNSLFIDCGANQGFYSIPIAGSHKDCEIYAFEPSNNEINDLKKNISINNFKNIYTYDLAIADKEGKFKFKDDNIENHSTKGGYIIDDPNINHKNISMVSATTLDKFIEKKKIKHNKKIFIKIDLEGYDINAIYGSTNLFNQYFTVILFEFSRMMVGNKIYSNKNFNEFLNSNNLIILDIKGKKLNLDILHEKLNSLKKKYNVCGNFLIIKEKNLNYLKFRN